MGVHQLRAVVMMCAVLTPPAVAGFRHLGHGLRPTERFLLGLTLALFALALPGLALALLGVPVDWCLWPSEFIWTAVALWPRKSAAAEPLASSEPLPERGQGFPAIAAIATAAGAVALVGGVALSTPFVRMWSDAWFHAGAAIEITIRGAPPQDPNFAGIPFYYPWFFHFLIALLGRVTGGTAFDVMSLINMWSAVVLVLAVAQLAYRAFGRSAAMWVGAIAVLGMDPFGWLLMVGRAMVGETRGFAGMIDGLMTSNGALNSLAYRFPPWHSSLLDRFWTGTAHTPAIALGVATAWSVARGLERPSRAAWVRTLAIALAAYAFHPAYAAIACACIAAAVVWATWGGARGPGFATLTALALALGVAIPYVRYCTPPGGATSATLGLYTRNAWSMLVAVGPWWLVAAPAFLAGRTGTTAGRFATAAVAIAVVTALVLILPENNSDKLFYMAWVALAPLLAAGWVWWGNRLRLPTVARVALLAALIVPTPGLYALGSALDWRSPGVLIRGDTPATRSMPMATPAEDEGYRYLRERITDNAIVIERPRPTVNEPVPVLGERRVFCGSLDVYLSNHFDAARASDPRIIALREEFEVRRAIQLALFSTGQLTEQQRLYLNGFPDALYLLVRRREVPDAIWNGFEMQPMWSDAFDNEEMRIYLYRRTLR